MQNKRNDDDDNLFRSHILSKTFLTFLSCDEVEVSGMIVYKELNKESSGLRFNVNINKIVC